MLSPQIQKRFLPSISAVFIGHFGILRFTITSNAFLRAFWNKKLLLNSQLMSLEYLQKCTKNEVTIAGSNCKTFG